MGTQISLFDQPNTNLPAHLQTFTSEVGKAMTIGGAGYNKIGLKGGRFHIIVNGQEESVLETFSTEVIIVGAAEGVSRIYFEGQYDSDTKTHPVCYSPTGVEPGADVTNPQSMKCANCPQNQKGSKVTPDGTKTKACQYFKRLGVVALFDPAHRIFQLDCKALTIFGEGQPAQNKFTLNEYAKKLKTRGLDPAHIVTKLSFDTDSSVPKLYFSPVRLITEEEAAWVQEIVQGDDVKQVTEIRAITDASDAESEGPAADVAAPAPSPAPKAAPAPAAKPAAAQSAPAPKVTVVRQTVPKATVAAPQPAPAKAPAPAPAPAVTETAEDDELAAFLNQLDSVED